MKLRSKLSIATITGLAPIAAATALSGCSRIIKYKEYHILTINDLHGAIPGYGEEVSVVDARNPGCFRIQKEVDRVMEKYPGSVFLSAGDENSGDSWSTCSHGQTTYPVLKSMGVRYCAVGNHAWEWGNSDTTTGIYDRLGRTDQTEGKYFVTSNVFSVDGYNPDQKKDWHKKITDPEFEDDFNLWNKLRVGWADPYKIINFGKAKVCLIGLTTTDTINDSNKEITSHLSFVDYKASINYTKYLAYKELGEEQYNAIDSFILFTHCGGKVDAKTKEFSGETKILAENLQTDIDAIISAHTHQTYCEQVTNKHSGKKIYVTQAGTAGRAISDIKIMVNPVEQPGKRVMSVTAEVRNIDVPKNFDEAKAEWDRYCNSNSTISTVAKAFNYEKQWVADFFSRYLSKVDLKKNKEEMQYPDKFDGYYNGIKEFIKPTTGEKIIPGHDYYVCKAVQDHFGGWMARSLHLGYYFYYRDFIQTIADTMPGACFITQDTAPSNLKSGDIRVREVYDMVPYDNQLTTSYVGILQLANIINYSLAGNPYNKPGEGFDFATPRKYKPNLCHFYGDTMHGQEELNKSHFRVCDDNLGPESNYVSGPMLWSGIRVNLKVIDDRERDLKDDEGLPIYDPTATYRVNTKEFDVQIGGSQETKKVFLPDIQVFNYIPGQSGDDDNIVDLDLGPEKAKNPYSWLTADQYLIWEQSTLQQLRLIPVITNSFMYKGGNGQTKLFAAYAEFNKKRMSPYFYEFTSTETTRSMLEYFYLNCLDEGFEWKDGIAPVNMPWSKISELVKVVN